MTELKPWLLAVNEKRVPAGYIRTPFTHGSVWVWGASDDILPKR